MLSEDVLLQGSVLHPLGTVGTSGSMVSWRELEEESEVEYRLTLDLVWRVGGWRATSEPQAPTRDVAS